MDMINMEREIENLEPCGLNTGRAIRCEELERLLLAVAAERDAALCSKHTMEQNLTDATHNYCTCGGRGPGDGCQACETYHWAMGTEKPNEALDLIAELEARIAELEGEDNPWGADGEYGEFGEE